jgi:hypothetical protein
MNRRKFVLTSTVSMLVITVAVAGLAFYSNFTANAFVQGVPNAIRYFPTETRAIFGINVPKFLASPVYTQLMQKHEQQIGQDLAEFTSKTGVDPRRDIAYIVGASWPGQLKGAGVVIAVGTFNRDAIIAFVNTKGTPIKVEYNGATVLMFPEANQLQKGIAFLGDSEIALGDLDSLHSVLDVRYGKSTGINDNALMRDLLGKVGSEEMFWFAGDATVLAKAPLTTPLMPNMSAIQNIFGTLNLGDPIMGKISVTAKDATSATQLVDFTKGLVALGSLAGAQNPDIAALAGGIQIAQSSNQFDISIRIPFQLLVKLDAAKTNILK